jgi:DNA polymerase III alpha subunit
MLLECPKWKVIVVNDLKELFKQLEDIGSYGFPECHAASLALLVYVSSWLKCHYHDIFACALLNSQPMGFYPPAQIVSDARKHGVEVQRTGLGEVPVFWLLQPELLLSKDIKLKLYSKAHS